MKKIFLFAFIVNLLSCGSNDPKGPDVPAANAPKIISYSIVSTLPHDTSSFTEGLLFYKDKMYEGTGEINTSRLAEVDLKTGKTIRSVKLDTAYFGEGIVIINDTVYQWTYKNKIGFMYSLKDFKKIGEFKYASEEGWGMTTDGKNIIASDGSSNLYFYEPGTFRLLKTQTITESGSPIANTNELEYIDGFIYANQYTTAYILKIDPNNGVVVGKIDLRNLTERIKATYPFIDVLNGIAYNPTTKKMYITGKYWPELYEIQLGQ